MTASEWEVSKAIAIKQGRDNARSRGGRKIELKIPKVDSVSVSTREVPA